MRPFGAFVNLRLPALLCFGIASLLLSCSRTEVVLSPSEPIVTLRITAQPQNTSVGAGQTATFTVSAVGAGLQYQWQRDSADIAGATDSSYTTLTAIGDSGEAFRCVISNAAGSLTSNTALLSVTGGGTITDTDIDGNVYKVVTIGTQVWMAENLKTTRYNDGTAIPLVTDNTAWCALTTPGYCWYNDSISYGNTYGALYNWYAVKTGKLAPTGWHVPTDSEWTILTTFLGGASVAGGPLKEAGTRHWLSPNTGATNSTGFSALPGGGRFGNGMFSGIGAYGYWWSSTADNVTYSWNRIMYYNDATVDRGLNTSVYGVGVRCVRNP
jgi:uncharacterized protein (TIGR02145 family)